MEASQAASERSNPRAGVLVADLAMAVISFPQSCGGVCVSLADDDAGLSGRKPRAVGLSRLDIESSLFGGRLVAETKRSIDTLDHRAAVQQYGTLAPIEQIGCGRLVGDVHEPHPAA